MLFALLIPVLIAILGFMVDYANMQRVRNEARMVADLSAKAAADTLARTGGDQAAAITAAKDVALANTIAGTPHDLQTSEIVFGRAKEQGDGSYSIKKRQLCGITTAFFYIGKSCDNTGRPNQIESSESELTRLYATFF